jgi:CheY-like chemotaxis protein
MGNYNELPPDPFVLLASATAPDCPGTCGAASCLSFEESHRLFQQLQFQQFQLETQKQALRQAEALSREQAALLEEFSDRYDFAPIGHLNLDRAGIILAVNLTGAQILRDERPFLVGRRLHSFISYDSRPAFYEFLARLFAGAPKDSCEIVFQLGRRPPVTLRLEAVLSESREECHAVLVDITKRRLSETYQEMGWEIVRILNLPDRPGALLESVQRVLAVVKLHTGFDVVGLRLKDGAGVLPFHQRSRPSDVLILEDFLIDLAADDVAQLHRYCSDFPADAFARVLSGRADPADPLWSPGGSFWSNDAPGSRGLPCRQQRQASPNNAAGKGYGSLALVPIRYQGEISGLLQLQSKSKGRLTTETVELLETITSCLGGALVQEHAGRERARVEGELLQVRKPALLGPLAASVTFNNEPRRRGRATILLVEEEPAILRLVTIMLETKGYQVLQSASAASAIRLAQTGSHEIRLLLTDVLLPEMGGRELARTVLCAAPRLKTLFMSSAPAEATPLEAGVHFIQKPFTMASLAVKVHEILESCEERHLLEANRA